MPTLKAGCFAYLDDYAAGLVPCKVIRVRREHHHLTGSQVVADVIVTAERRGYFKGEAQTCTARYCVPRDAIRRFRGKPHPTVMPYEIEIG